MPKSKGLEVAFTPEAWKRFQEIRKARKEKSSIGLLELLLAEEESRLVKKGKLKWLVNREGKEAKKAK